MKLKDKIIVPFFKKEEEEIKLNVGVRMSGHYQLVVTSEARGSRVVAEFDNLILNSGLDHLPVGNCADWCRVGTGTTTPAVGQTNLTSQVGSTSDRSTIAEIVTYVPAVTGPPATDPYCQMIRNYRFATGQATGTLAEIGVGWASSGSTLFSRALILDSLGSPTTITILSDETLDVKYIFRLYPPLVDVTGTTSIGGDAYNYLIRASEIDDTNFWNPSSFLGFALMGITTQLNFVYFPIGSVLGTLTTSPSGGSSSFGNIAPTPGPSAYVGGSYSRTWGVTADLTRGNQTGGLSIFTYLISGSSTFGGKFQVQFTPAIPKDNSKTLKLVFGLTWGRY